MKTTWTIFKGTVISAALCLAALPCQARDVDYKDGEIPINVNPGEPTEIRFPGMVKGGYKKKNSSLYIDKKDTDLIVFANEGLNDKGEAIIVRLDDGRSYPLRVRLADQMHPRDDTIKIDDKREAGSADEEEELQEYKEKKSEYAPPSSISGFVREMVLVSEFGKKSIPGYRASDRYKGETVLHDGTVRATIDKIFIGPNLWGYVIDTENMLDQTQQINPASFRIDGTRAISAQRWELAPRPLTIEQQISGKDKVKVYVVTKAKSYR